MIHSEHDSHFSLLDYLALNSSWRLVTGDADCRWMIPWKWHRRRKVFFWRWQKPTQNGWSFGLFSCCSNVCIQNFVRLYELTVSDNGEGLAVGRRQVSIQTISYCLHCIAWIVIATRVSGFHIEIFEVFSECRRLNVFFLSPDYVNNNFVLLFRNVLAYFSCRVSRLNVFKFNLTRKTQIASSIKWLECKIAVRLTSTVKNIKGKLCTTLCILWYCFRK